MGFIYKNLPSFTLSAGDIIAFDTAGVQNDFPLTFNISLSPTTTNGGNIPVGYTQIITAGTAADPNGNTIVGDYELAYTVQTGFNFTGGGLVIRLAPTGASLADSTFDQNLVHSGASDTSGLFVGRFFGDNDGFPPYGQPASDSGFDSTQIAVFRLITGVDPQPATVPEPSTIAIFGAALLGFGWVQRRRRV